VALTLKYRVLRAVWRGTVSLYFLLLRNNFIVKGQNIILAASDSISGVYLYVGQMTDFDL
jgi:hypothetical protein